MQINLRSTGDQANNHRAVSPLLSHQWTKKNPQQHETRHGSTPQIGHLRAQGVLVERFTSYMTIIQDTLVAIFAKPDDEGGMAVSIRCVNTAEELAEYDAELAQDAQRQTEAEAGELVAWPTGAPLKQSHRPNRMLIGRVRGCARSRCTGRRPVVQCIEVWVLGRRERARQKVRGHV